MVDFRPLLFVNALALMLLVTAGLASVQKTMPERSTPASANTLTPVTAGGSADPGEAVATAAEEPAAAITTRVDAPVHTPVVAPEPPPTTTGTLVLRSNVIGDKVTINGKAYGATRLDLELDPGRYEVVIEKPGYQPWSNAVILSAGQQLTLAGRLEAYTTVSYHNGAWVGGVTTGDGSWQDSSGLRYQGHFVDGEFHGTGTAWFADGRRYEGDWAHGKRDGEGQWHSADGATYTGQFHNDEFHGQGTLTLDKGDILTGTWVRGSMNGHGSLSTADGMLYVGGFRNDEFHGQGALTYPDGRSYEGEFSNGEFHGRGSEILADGKKYDGQYMAGRFHGNGLLRNPNGSSIEATFRHGEPYGQVRLITAAGEIFTARTTEPGVCYRDKSYRATQCPQLDGW
ncbi:MAG: PEGA domain-containing protein [Marinobacter sp.]